jgi:hydrogenase-4 component B
MPLTALCFLTGAVAICGLPPLNGFVGEFIIYLGLFRSAIDAGDSSFPIAAFAAPALALIGALAVACFVKVFGTVFLGTPRTPQAAAVAGESGPSMIAAMSVLALCCVFIGAAPIAVAPAFRAAVADWAPAVNADRVGEPIPWIGLTAAGSALAALIAVSALLLRARVGRGPVSAAPTWGCGYPAPTPRMQYTSSSFAQMLVDLFSWALRPRVHRPQSLPLFPDKADFHSKVADPVLDQAAIPAFRLGARVLSWFRVLQQGSVRLYLLYVFVVLVALLLWR